MKKLILFVALCLVIASCAPSPSNVTPTASPTSPGQAPSETPPPSSATPPNGITPTSPAGQPGKVPNFDHIIMLMFENRSYKDVIDGQGMPYLTSLAGENVLLTNYTALTHPSLPNYIGMISGSTQGITNDCIDCFVDKTNLADLIEASGRTWKDYQEDMPGPCFIGNADPYMQKHNPFIYFNDIRTDAARCKRSIVPLTSLDADLAANKLPNFAFIMPNMCNSGHNCPSSTADAWLKAMVTKLQASTALGGNSLIVITFDEAATSDKSTCCGLPGTGGGQIATVLVSPQAQKGFQDNTAYSHYSLLKTYMAAWGLPDLENTSLPGIQPIAAPFGTGGASAGGQPLPGGQAQSGPVGQCVTAGPASGKYNVNLCLSQPAGGNTISGDIPINVSLKVTETSAGTAKGHSSVQRVIFYLDGNYLISDFQSPYTFTLPTANWPDGSHTLSVEVQMHDAFITPQAGLDFTFKNGVSSTPSAPAGQFHPTSGTTPTGKAPFIVAAAGDGASGESNARKVSDLIASLNPNLFLYLGDVYERGSPLEFLNYFGGQDGVYGRFKPITDPAIGNHEYLTENASGYFNYWDNIPSYYSFDVTIPGGTPNGWHFISLNSNTQRVPAGSGSAQYQWLAADLAAHAGACTVVYYHHPLYNVGPEGPTTDMGPVWKLLAQSNVSIVLNGHDHDYQRWQPLDGNGQVNSGGVTEFIVGGGGHGLQTFKNSDNRTAYVLDANPQGFGTLLLQLNPDGATFSYHSVDGSIPDSGVVPCAGHPADKQAPSTPAGLTVTGTIAGKVDLRWGPSSDNTGVASYMVYRDGNLVARLPSGALTYADAGVEPRTTYNYTVIAADPAGNDSAPSNQVQAITPDVAASQTFAPVADTYVTEESPTFNYGISPVLRVDSAPDVRSFLRFEVTGLGGRQVARATLKIYANSGSNRGISLFSVPDNNWDENLLNYGSLPQTGSLLSTSQGFKAGDWISLDVSAFVTGEGQYSFSIGTPGDTSISLASRESGPNSPQLLIELH